MLLEDSAKKKIAIAVAIAAASALATKLIEWGVDEIKQIVRPKKDDNSET